MSRSQSLVARPTSTSRMPVAKGSSVPAWPILVPLGRRYLMMVTALAEDMPAGLSRLRMPFIAAAGYRTDVAAGYCRAGNSFYTATHGKELQARLASGYVDRAAAGGGVCGADDDAAKQPAGGLGLP